jgi:hypothetical protein
MDTDQLDEEQLYYKEKYFKYKLKYLTLKEHLGGNKRTTVPAARSAGSKAVAVQNTGPKKNQTPVAKPAVRITKSINIEAPVATGKGNNILGDLGNLFNKVGDTVTTIGDTASTIGDTVSNLGAPNAQTQTQAQAQAQAQAQTQPRKKSFIEQQEDNRKNERIRYFLATLFFRENESNIKQFVTIQKQAFYNYSKEDTFNKLIDNKLDLYDSDPNNPNITTLVDNIISKGLQYYNTSDMNQDKKNKLRTYLLKEVQKFIINKGHLNNNVYYKKLIIKSILE